MGSVGAAVGVSTDTSTGGAGGAGGGGGAAGLAVRFRGLFAAARLAVERLEAPPRRALAAGFRVAVLRTRADLAFFGRAVLRVDLRACFRAGALAAGFRVAVLRTRADLAFFGRAVLRVDLRACFRAGALAAGFRVAVLRTRADLAFFGRAVLRVDLRACFRAGTLFSFFFAMHALLSSRSIYQEPRLASAPLPSVPADYDQQLKRLRRRLQLTQDGLAHRVGAARKAVVYQWESRKRMPSPVFWQRIQALSRHA